MFLDDFQRVRGISPYENYSILKPRRAFGRHQIRFSKLIFVSQHMSTLIPVSGLFVLRNGNNIFYPPLLTDRFSLEGLVAGMIPFFKHSFSVSIFRNIYSTSYTTRLFPTFFQSSIFSFFGYHLRVILPRSLLFIILSYPYIPLTGKAVYGN